MSAISSPARGGLPQDPPVAIPRYVGTVGWASGHEAHESAGRVAAAAIFAFLLFANVPFYLYSSGSSPVPPWAFAFTLAVGGMFCAVRPATLAAALRDPLIWWCLLVVAVSCWGLIVAPASTTAAVEFGRRLLASAVLATAFVLFRRPRTLIAVQLAIAWGVLVGSIVNLYELSHPLAFSAVIGRSAGFYINPNISGGALAAGAIAIAAASNRWWRYPLVGLATLAIISTLSRGALLVWLCCTGLLAAGGRIRLRPLLVSTGLAAGLAIALVAPGLSASGLDLAQVLENVTNGRGGRLLVWQARRSDDEAGARFEAAREAWRLFQQRPLVGHGIAATTTWDGPQSTHNAPLRGAAENGLVGLLLVPALAWAIAFGRSSRTHSLGVTYAVFMVGWSLFSHNLLEELPFIIVAAFVAATIRPLNGVRRT